MKYTATRRIQFCAGHRVMEHGSKCRNMHGHNYVALIFAEAKDLNNLGMVIDFAVLKDVIGKWIDENWDHGFIYYHKDTMVRDALGAFENSENVENLRKKRTTGFVQKLYALPHNPTAENMAAHLLDISNVLLENSGVKVTKVQLWETENCFSEVTL